MQYLCLEVSKLTPVSCSATWVVCLTGMVVLCTVPYSTESLGTSSGGVVAVAGFGATSNMLGTMFHTQLMWWGVSS